MRIVLIFLLLCSPALAHDAGHPELNEWFNRLASGRGLCCSFADGSAVSDVDWESKDGHYRVRLEGRWIDVPDDAVITEPNRAGRTMVWPMLGTKGDTIRNQMLHAGQHGLGHCQARAQRVRLAVSRNSCTETGTSSYSAKRRRSSSAISRVTSRDQPSAVLKATMRVGWPYWPSMRLRISVSRSVSSSLVSHQARPSRSPKSSSTRYVSWLDTCGTIEGDRLGMTQLHGIGDSPAFSTPPVPMAAGSNRGLTSACNSRRWLNAFTMAGSHGSAEAATPSVASIKSASQTVLGSALAKAERSIKMPISASDTGRRHEPQRCQC